MTLGASTANVIGMGLLFGVQPTDPTTLGTVAVALGIVCLAACIVPARRAAGVAPLDALRVE